MEVPHHRLIALFLQTFIKSHTMKKFTFLSLFLLFCLSSTAQITTELRIYHKLGTQAFQFNTTTQSSVGDDYQITRLQYYMTKFTVIHDGGQETIIDDAVVALVNASDGAYSVVELGSLNLTNVEGVKFHIGVHSPVNNENPGLYPSDHPLAPQAPSMHWGWASGYRFLVYEGKGGTNFSQTFQMHGLGNGNYFETTVNAVGQNVGGTMYIVLDADYTMGVENIDVSAGVIAHGVDQEDRTCLENFRDYVFSQSTEVLVAGTEEQDQLVDWSVYPNPTSGEVNISIDNTIDFDQVRVTNALGETISLVAEEEAIVLNDAGVYFIQLLNDGAILGTQRIVKN